MAILAKARVAVKSQRGVWLFGGGAAVATVAFGWMPEVGVPVVVEAIGVAATTVAVIVAIWAGRLAVQEGERNRRAAVVAADQARALALADAEKERDLTAAALSLALDHELYMLAGQLRGPVDYLAQPGVLYANPYDAILKLTEAIPRNTFVNMSRFADRFVVYGEAGAAQLMVALGQYNFIREAPFPPADMANEEHDYLLGAATGTLKTIVGVIGACERARLVIKPYVQRFQPEYREVPDPAPTAAE